MLGADPETILVRQEWVQKAENDLVAAAHLLRLGRRCPTDTVCFHSQQCVEKYPKALLVNHGRDVPKTHGLRVLMAQLPIAERPDLTPEEQQQLTDNATIARYPGDYAAISLADARKAVKCARRVRRQIPKRLPSQALRADLR
jgi:HEPN domain-containing protein